MRARRAFLFVVVASASAAATACGNSSSTGPQSPLHDESGGWEQVVASNGVTCGLDRGGTAYCWGKNDAGQLGDGTQSPHATPARVQGNLHFTMLATGSLTTCGITAGGSTYCWGYYAVDLDLVPTLVDSSHHFTSMAVGAFSVCGLTADGSAYCWSLIRTDQVPALLPGGHQFRTITLAYTSFSGSYCGVAANGSAYCWGEGIQADSQVVLQPVASVAKIVSDGQHWCAIGSSGLLHCWGDNSAGEVGDGSTAARLRPVPIAGNTRFASVGMTLAQTCATGAAGDAYCWGDLPANSGVVSPALTPAKVLPGLRVDSVSVGGDHACFLTPGGAAYCLGINGAGQLGNGLTTSPDRPVRVLDPS